MTDEAPRNEISSSIRSIANPSEGWRFKPIVVVIILLPACLIFGMWFSFYIVYDSKIADPSAQKDMIAIKMLELFYLDLVSNSASDLVLSQANLQNVSDARYEEFLGKARSMVGDSINNLQKSNIVHRDSIKGRSFYTYRVDIFTDIREEEVKHQLFIMISMDENDNSIKDIGISFVGGFDFRLSETN